MRQSAAPGRTEAHGGTEAGGDADDAKIAAFLAWLCWEGGLRAGYGLVQLGEHFRFAGDLLQLQRPKYPISFSCWF